MAVNGDHVDLFDEDSEDLRADHTPVSIPLEDFKILPIEKQIRTIFTCQEDGQRRIMKRIRALETYRKKRDRYMLGALGSVFFAMVAVLIMIGQYRERIDATADTVKTLSEKLDRLLERR